MDTFCSVTGGKAVGFFFACGSSIVAQFGSYLHQHGMTTNIQFPPFEV